MTEVPPYPKDSEISKAPEVEVVEAGATSGELVPFPTPEVEAPGERSFSESLILRGPRAFALWTLWGGVLSALLASFLFPLLPFSWAPHIPELTSLSPLFLFLGTVGLVGMALSLWIVIDTRGLVEWRAARLWTLDTAVIMTLAAQFLTLLLVLLAVLTAAIWVLV